MASSVPVVAGRLAPSFIGTTIATIVAALYAFWRNDPVLHLWTDLVRFTVICGPAMVLLTYSLTVYIVENQPVGSAASSALGWLEYPVRVASQILLCLSLAALSENIVWYIVLFMAFMSLNFVWSLSVYRSMPQMFAYDLFNFLLSDAYSLIALHIHDIATGFERTYPAFVLDTESLNARVSELRGQQSEFFSLLCLVFGAICVNLLWLMHGPWREHYRATRRRNDG